jgi:adenylate cyclase
VAQNSQRQIVDDKQARWATLLWHDYLTGEHKGATGKLRVMRSLFKWLPGSPRCKICDAPLSGPSSHVVALIGFGTKLSRSRFNPNLCDQCERIVTKYQAGVETQVTLLFADVRGSTTMAEKMRPADYHAVIDRFYKAATDVMVHTDALIDKLVGDEVIGLYVPGVAGDEYPRKAVQAGIDMLRATGHADSGAPWLPIGVGIHTGTAYLGAVGSHNGMSDITALGDAVNTAARLASQAKSGEVLVSDETCKAIGMHPEDCEKRSLSLKGRAEPVDVFVLKVDSAVPV